MIDLTSSEGDMVLAEMKVKYFDNPQDTSDKISLEFPKNASVVANFEAIRSEARKVLFPEDKKAFLAMGRGGARKIFSEHLLKVNSDYDDLLNHVQSNHILRFSFYIFFLDVPDVSFSG